jgi:hypothetical protein
MGFMDQFEKLKIGKHQPKSRKPSSLCSGDLSQLSFCPSALPSQASDVLSPAFCASFPQSPSSASCPFPSSSFRLPSSSFS